MEDPNTADLTGLDTFRPPSMGDLNANVSSAEGGRERAQESLNTEIAMPPQEPTTETFQEKPPQRNIGGLMAMSPWMIALSIFGGARTKLSANNMLAATNGMIQGLTSGDEQRYQEEYAKWQQEHKTFADLQKQKWQIYKEMAQVYKNRVDGKERALQVAEQAVRDARKDRSDAMSAYLQTVKASLALKDEGRKWAEVDEKVRSHKESERLKKEALDTKAATAGKGSTAKKQTHDEQVAQANRLIDELTKQLQADESRLGVTGIGGKVRRVGESVANITGVSSDTSAHDFENRLSDLQLLLAPLLASSGRTGKDQREKLETIVRGLKAGDTRQNTLSALKDLRARINSLPAGSEHGEVVRTGTYNDGKTERKVVQYSDGFVDYGD